VDQRARSNLWPVIPEAGQLSDQAQKRFSTQSERVRSTRSRRFKHGRRLQRPSFRFRTQASSARASARKLSKALKQTVIRRCWKGLASRYRKNGRLGERQAGGDPSGKR